MGCRSGVAPKYSASWIGRPEYTISASSASTGRARRKPVTALFLVADDGSDPPMMEMLGLEGKPSSSRYRPNPRRSSCAFLTRPGCRRWCNVTCRREAADSDTQGALPAKSGRPCSAERRCRARSGGRSYDEERTTVRYSQRQPASIQYRNSQQCGCGELEWARCTPRYGSSKASSVLRLGGLDRRALVERAGHV